VIAEQSDALAFTIRPATDADVPWVYSSWLKSYREHGSGVSRIPRETYYNAHRKRIDNVASQATTLVACAPENHEQILGWLCAAAGVGGYDAVLYYGHVKSHCRRQGIMRALIAALGITKANNCAYTHHTKISWVESSKLKSVPLGDIVPPSWQLNPYLFA
jgi:ribosomal protein S18 acetylase RimI-like enzyme